MSQETIAKALVFNSEGKVLLLQVGVHKLRPEKSHTPDLPGGVIEAGEDVELGLVREIKEEVGLVVDPQKLRLAYGNTTFYKAENKSVTKLLYVVTVSSVPQSSLSWEHEAYRWCDLKEVAETEFSKVYADAISHLYKGKYIDSRVNATTAKVVVCAKLLLRDAGGKYLVLYRSNTHPRWPLSPDLPGGEVEVGEVISEALHREVYEESGMLLGNLTPRSLCASTSPHEGDTLITHLLYEADIDALEPKITLSWEHERYAWLTLDELQDFEPAFQESIDYARRYRFVK